MMPMWLVPWTVFINAALLSVSTAAAGLAVHLVGQISNNNTPQVLRRSGSGWTPKPIEGHQPLFGVTVDAAGTAWTVEPSFGGSCGPPRAGLWRRTG